MLRCSQLQHSPCWGHDIFIHSSNTQMKKLETFVWEQLRTESLLQLKYSSTKQKQSIEEWDLDVPYMICKKYNKYGYDITYCIWCFRRYEWSYGIEIRDQDFNWDWVNQDLSPLSSMHLNTVTNSRWLMLNERNKLNFSRNWIQRIILTMLGKVGV